MSKIGNKPIDITGVQVEVKGNEVHFKGKNHTGTCALPAFLSARVEGNKLLVRPVEGQRWERKDWGLHRALLANAIKGAAQDFQENVEITGLGFKVQVTGKNMVFSLGYTHKITMELPAIVKLSVDKTGQKLTFTSFDREKLGQVCALIRAMRPTEPYKGTGIKLAGETVIRKAGKAKAGASGAA